MSSYLLERGFRARRLSVLLTMSLLAVLLSPWASPLPTGRAQAQTQAATSFPVLYGSAPDAPDSQLQAIVEDTVGDLGGTWGVAIKKLDTGQYAAFNGDKQQVSASLFKIWVLAELFRQAKNGDVSLDGYSSVTNEDAAYDALSGDQRLNVGDSLSLRNAAYQMITVSDNTAASLLVRVLGPDNINNFMKQNGLSNSYLDWGGVGDNLTTPIDVLREMELIGTSKMVDAEASKQMITMMLDQQINDLLPTGLPNGTPFAHKTGDLDALLHDAGIVYGPSGPFILVVMSSNLDSYNTANDAFPKLASRIYDYFNSRPSAPAMYFPESRQSVAHEFLKFWQVYGGLKTFGYPLGPEQLSNGVLVQQFERARFEWRPELIKEGGPVPGVVLSPLGQQRAAQLNLSWSPGPDLGKGKYYQQTGQAIQGGFYEYWLNNGGERIFGMPISPEVQLQSPTDGKMYTTQYFQRARMEYHPELPPGQQVVLAAIGTEMASSR